MKISKKIIAVSLSLIMIFSACFISFSISAQAEIGTTYYVDSQNGSDSNSGLSQSSAWQTLAKISSFTFSQGDKILLKRGSVFDNQSVNLKGNGTKENPVTLSAYGDGDSMPLINAGGQKYAVQLRNQSHWIVENLEITNTASVDRFYSGISINASGTYNSYTNIVIRNNKIHDITCGRNSYVQNGTTIYTEEGAGIYVFGDNYTTDYNNLLLENNIITDVRGNGIFFRAGYSNDNPKTYEYGLDNIVRNNYLENIGYDGILMQGCIGALIEYNVVNHSHDVSRAAEVAIWPFGCDDCVFQYNEAYNTQTTSDGQAFDCDYQCNGTVFQYNYGHDNVGGFMLICTEDRFRPQGGNGMDAYNNNSIIRYNISQNNAARQFQLLGHIKNTKVYNNTIATRWGISAVAVDTFKKNATYTSSEFEGTRPDFPIDTLFANNLFYDFSSCPTGSYVSKYSFESGTPSGVTGYATNTVWDNNLVYGRSANQAPTAVKTADDGTVIIASAENNINADPMLLNPFSAKTGLESCEGYKLLEGSPALGAGKVIEDNGGKDFFGNAVSATEAPNIGAYQGPGVKDSSTKIYYDDKYKTLTDWESEPVGRAKTNISNITYVYAGTDGNLTVTDDKTKLLSSIGSTRGLIFTPKLNNAQINMQFYSQDIKNSKSMRFYMYGNGTACSATVKINGKYQKSFSVPAEGGFINIAPGDKVYSSSDGGNISLTKEICQSISSLNFTFTSSSGKTIYIDDFQINMEDNIPSESENPTINIPVDITPGAEQSPLVPTTTTTQITTTASNYTIIIDGTEYIKKPGESFDFPVNNDNSFIGYLSDDNLYSSGETINVTSNISCTSAYMNISMRKGASMRLNEKTGLRFYTIIDTQLISKLRSLGTEISLGTLIAPNDLLGNDDLTTALLPEKRCVNVPYTSENYFIENNKEYIVGSIVNILDKNATRDFVGRGYVTVTINGIEKTFYANYAEGNIDNNKRSVGYIANCVRNDKNYFINLSDNNKAIINKYAELYNIKFDPIEADKF